MQAALQTGFAESIYSFCGSMPGSFFSWHLDRPSTVVVDVRSFLRIRMAAMSYHQTQICYFIQPPFPGSWKKYFSAVFGYVFCLFEVGRRRIPIATPRRFFKKYPQEGLALLQSPTDGRPHFFRQYFTLDTRIRFI